MDLQRGKQVPLMCDLGVSLEAQETERTLTESSKNMLAPMQELQAEEKSLSMFKLHKMCTGPHLLSWDTLLLREPFREEERKEGSQLSVNVRPSCAGSDPRLLVISCNPHRNLTWLFSSHLERRRNCGSRKKMHS